MLSQADGIGVGGLAAAFGVISGAVTQLVDALRVDGLVTSEVNPADRRGRIIRPRRGRMPRVSRSRRSAAQPHCAG